MTTLSGSVAALLALALSCGASRAQDVAAPAQPVGQVDQTVNQTADQDTDQAKTTTGPPGVRIVRLSQVKGDVQLDRGTEHGFEMAFANLPIVQNQRLQTHEGIAEVEFEDNSTLRITPNTQIEFPALQRSSSGTTTTSIKLLSGTLYVSLAPGKVDNFTVSSGKDTITVTPSSHIRIDATPTESKLTVFNGTALVADTSGTTTVGKKKSLLLNAATPAPPTVDSHVTSEQFDDWDKTEMDYHKLRSIPAAYNGSSYAYGINDLNYYGSFSNFGGCGTMWRPYLASAAWDPFANGVWAWYPNAGYSWVSPYPWGWTPFHYGSWQYCSTGGGWGWRPGGQWYGIRNHPTALSPTNCPTCPRPPHPPVNTGRATLVVVNAKPLSVSRLTSPDTFVFHKDSAGMGVPRETLGKLNKISAGVAQHGTVATSVYAPAAAQPGHESHASNSLANTPTHINNQSANSYASRSSSASASSNASRSSSASGSFSHSSSAPSAPSSSGASSSASSGGGSHH
jgi:FecR protein